MYMYRVKFIWCEAMLLVVNMVTCPIGTDCGGSAPVVGVFRQPRLAEGVLPTGNYIGLLYCTRVAKYGSAVASEGDNSRGGAKGAVPGRVREGGTPPAQLGGMGERCELPHRGLGRSPRSQRFLRLKKLLKLHKNAARPRPLLYMYKYVY